MRSTYSPAYGTAVLPEPGAVPRPFSVAMWELGQLIQGLSQTEPFRCFLTCRFGDAGYVTLRYDLDPSKLTPEVRHELLSTAARLVNWDHE